MLELIISSPYSTKVEFDLFVSSFLEESGLLVIVVPCSRFDQSLKGPRIAVDQVERG